MADALGIETRSRSRSKTPGLLFGENGDSKNAKKIPTISLIEEEDDVVEVIPSSQGSRPRRQRRSAKVVTSDTSTDVSTDSFKTTTASKSSVVTTTVTEVVKRSTNGSKEESSEQATSTTITKSTIEGPDAPESQSIFNNIFNAIKTSTPILTNKRSTRITQDVMSPSVNIAEHPAYKEYKEAGEYWNKYPKTDYTYSELSPHRRELKNGVVAMPNMSRRSLEKYQNRVEVMIQNNPAEESFLRRKFLTTSNMSFQKRSADLQYDSTDEVDVSELRRTLQNRRKPADNIVSRFFLMIISYFYSSYYSVTQFFRRVFYRTNSRYTYTPIRKQKGFFSRASEAIKKFVLLGFSKVYIFVSTILCLDTWILYSRSDNADKVARRRRFLLLLLILLPLLLLGGTYIYLDPPKNLSFPKITFPKISFPKITLPSLPEINFPTISLPSLPTLAWPAFLTFALPSFNFSWPEISFEWLKFSRPDWLKFPELSFSWPKISFEWLSFSRPEWLKFPDLSFSFPEISLPSFNWPSITLPSFSWPSISLPSLPKISLPSIPSFDFGPYFEYMADKFSAFKDSSVEIFDKICEATFGLLNEAQIVWNENFNAVSNVK